MSQDKIQKTGVSQAAKNFFTKNAAAVEEARNAENVMQCTTLPMGYKGSCIVVNSFSEELKQKKLENGQMSEPGVMVVLEFSVINDETNQGVKITKRWYIQTQGKASWQNKLEWMLNEFENQLGVTRDERKMEMEQLLELLTKRDTVYQVEIRSGYQGRKEADISIGTSVDTTTSTTTTNQTYVVGAKVIFMDTPAEVVEVVDNDNVKIKTQSGNVRVVMISQIQPI